MPPTKSDVLDRISALNEGDPGVDAGDVRDTISAFNEANEGKPGFGPTPVSEAEPPDVEVVGQSVGQQPGPTNTPSGTEVMDPSPDTEEVVGESIGRQPSPQVTNNTNTTNPSPNTEDVVSESVGRQPSPQVTNNTTTTDKGPRGTTSGTSPVVGEDIGQTPDNTIGITSTDSSIDGSMGMDSLDPKLIIGAVAVALVAFAR